MDYRVRRTAAELNSTEYVEIGPGKYSGTHWQDGFLFVRPDAFEMAEGILTTHFPNYDRLSMNEVPKGVGCQVAAEWRDVAGRLKDMTPEQAHRALNLRASEGELVSAEALVHREEIVCMLRELADALDEFYEREEWVCILGM